MAVVNNSGLIAIVVAVRREAEAALKELSVQDIRDIEGQRFYMCHSVSQPVVLAVVGMGPEMARKGARSLIKEYAPEVIISLGFAGAVVPYLRTGEVLLGEEIYHETNMTRCFSSDSSLLEISEKALNNASIHCKRGKFVTVSSPVCTVENKKAFGAKHNCHCVDMETAVLAEMAYEQKIPFLSIRVVFDELKDRLMINPLAITKNGKLAISKTVWTMFCNPALIPALMRLKSLWTTSQKSIQSLLRPVLKNISDNKR